MKDEIIYRTIKIYYIDIYTYNAVSQSQCLKRADKATKKIQYLYLLEIFQKHKLYKDF